MLSWGERMKNWSVRCLCLVALLVTAGLPTGCSDDDERGTDSPTDVDAPADEDADTGVDMPTDGDTETDRGTPTDEGTETDVGSNGACSPRDMSGFEPVWKPPLGLALGVCSEEQIADYIAFCLARTATVASCDVWSTDEENTACLACAVTPYENDALGALSRYTDFGVLPLTDGNPGQCISAFEGDYSAASCGARFDAGRQCGIEACKGRCRLDRVATFSADLNALNACITEASEGTCSSLRERSQDCYEALIGHGDPVDQCIWTSGGFVDYAMRLVTVICGPAHLAETSASER